MCADKHVVLSVKGPILRSNFHQNSTKTSWNSWPLKVEPICCAKTSVQNYHSTLRYIRQERRSRLHRDKTLKSHILQFCFVGVACCFTTYIHFFLVLFWCCSVLSYFDRFAFPPWEDNTMKISHHSVEITPYDMLTPKMDPYNLYLAPWFSRKLQWLFPYIRVRN